MRRDMPDPQAEDKTITTSAQACAKSYKACVELVMLLA